MNRWGQVIEKRQKGRVLSPRIDRRGYHKVNPCVEGRTIYTSVHRLVCTAFHGPSATKLAAHNDGNPSNNRPQNLRWATAKENTADTKIHGTDGTGARNPNVRIGEDEVRQIRDRASEPARLLGIEFGVSESQVFNIIHGRSWGHLPGAKEKPKCNRKLTDAQRHDIICSPLSGAELGRKYGVSKEAIYAIWKRAERKI